MFVIINFIYFFPIVYTKIFQLPLVQSRIDAIGAACSCVEKAINYSHKFYALGTFHTLGIIPPMDKVQVAKIEEQEKLLRAAANLGEGEDWFQMRSSISLLTMRFKKQSNFYNYVFHYLLSIHEFQIVTCP